MYAYESTEQFFFGEIVNRAMIFAFYKLFAVMCKRGAFL